MDNNSPGKFKVGDQVLILKPHPHAGKTGKVVTLEILGLIAHRGPRPRVRLDDGTECFLVRDQDGMVFK